MTDQQNPMVEEDLEEMGKSGEVREGCEELTPIIIKTFFILSQHKGDWRVTFVLDLQLYQ